MDGLCGEPLPSPQNPHTGAMISVLILTRNEAEDLPGCLASVAWSDDVHVYDSFSTDDTVGIAQSAGAHVRQRTFDGYATQRNSALEECPFQHEWVLILDADERVPADTASSMRALVSAVPDRVCGYRLRRRDHFEGRWLRHAQMTPHYIRLVRRGSARYHREVNEVLEVRGEVVDSGLCFDHHPFSKGIGHWIRRHERYACMEAGRLLQERSGDFGFSLSKALFDRDFNVRRYHWKGLFYRLPMRPLIKWCYLMFWRRAFLDGGPGIRYAGLQAFYEHMIDLHRRELGRREPQRDKGRSLRE